MAKLTKILLDCTQQGNPKALIWVDDMDTTKQEAITINIKSQVDYIACLNVGAVIELAKNGQWYNVKVPKQLSDYMESKIKAEAILTRNILNNMHASIEHIKNAGTTLISVDELTAKISEYSKERDIIAEAILSEAKTNKILKNVLAPLLKIDDEKIKPADKAVALSTLSELVNIFERNIVTKNNYRISLGE